MTAKTRAMVMASVLALGCGESADGSIELTVEFPGAAAQVSTNSLHFWVLEQPDIEVPPGCRELELGDISPYDLDFVRRADLVVITADTTTATAVELPRRQLLVYAEGVDFIGVPQIAGCQPIEVDGNEALTIALRNRGALDCNDPETPDGAPCDDGMFCNVGETCRGGVCQGGGPRDCTHLADDCNGESCNEDLGCQPLAVPDSTPCFDGVFCTAGDTCQAGVCVPGAAFDCTGTDDECNVGVCQEGVSDAECVAVPTNEGLACTTVCASAGTCDTGACVGVEGATGPTDPTCSDMIDNDCDTLEDALDPDCQ